MAGAGESRQALQDSVSAWGLASELRLVGIRADVPALMRAADVLLFPSTQEGLGMVAVEAQATGLPVLTSTAVPREAIVIPELVKALPVSEPVNHWADVLMQIMSAPRMPAEVYRSAMHASAFSITNSSRSLLRIYSGGRRFEGRVA
jgi:glycosyltransferase involved in cell wall biosynthesis